MLRRTIICAIAIGLPLASACGSHPTVTASSAPPHAPKPAGPLVLAQFDRGVGAIRSGSDDPVWSDRAAVAALDGSAVFSVRDSASGSDLVRIDPDTGAALASWQLPAGAASISAVSPGGRWVALTDAEAGYLASSPRPSTRLVVFDALDGRVTRELDLTGDLRPEAFSVDGKLVFALDYRGDHYRVHTIDLGTGEQYDTGSRDKTVEREDMHGVAVRGVLNADHTLLATLYRNPGNRDEPAFVHILDLEHGWAYCADLTAPFGTGPEGSDVIELTPAGTLIVAATNAARIAEIHIEEVHEPSARPVTIEYRDGTIAPTERTLDAPGSPRVIATLG